MASAKRVSRSSRPGKRRRHGNSRATQLMHDMTWSWTTRAISGLREIASEAKTSSKSATTLADKVELQRLAKRAEAAHATIARVFGD